MTKRGSDPFAVRKALGDPTPVVLGVGKRLCLAPLTIEPLGTTY